MTRQLLMLMTAEQAEAFARLVEAANAGDGAAACRIGDMYREGTGGLRYSPKETHRWYAKSALAGDANGQNNLGACYEHGLGCTQSYARAMKWYRRAAAQRLGTASMNLAYCLLRGKGVPSDRAEALRLFRVAVDQGERRAAEELERLGEPVVDPSREFELLFPREPAGLAGATLKDDCFDLPEPGSPGAKRLEESLARIRAYSIAQGTWPKGTE